MAKVRELVCNQELLLWCRRKTAMPVPFAQRVPVQSDRKKRQNFDDWLQARIPALHGRIPSDPALLRLRQLFSSTY